MAITYNDLFLDIRRELKKGGVIDTTLEARELVCFGVNKSREELTRDGRLYAPPELERRVRELTARHLAGEPVAQGISLLRQGRLAWQPGFDGVYGKLSFLD